MRGIPVAPWDRNDRPGPSIHRGRLARNSDYAFVLQKLAALDSLIQLLYVTLIPAQLEYK